MNKKTKFSLLCVGIAAFFSQQALAQNTDPDEDVNLWMQQPVVIDGNSSEWHEPLNNYNTPTQLAFALANDQQNLYLIIESLDAATTGKLLRGGLTLNINTLGKKKDGIKLKFLGMQQPAPPHEGQNDSLQHAEHQMIHADEHEHSPGLTVIQVSGFKKIPDGSLAIPNKEGIEVAAAFNKQRDYICELSIPLSLLELKGNEVKAIAYNIKINAGNKAERPDGAKRSPEGAGHGRSGGMAGGMGGGGGMLPGGGGGGGRHGGGMHGGMGGESSGGTKSSDFWIKYELAKPAASFRAN